MFDAKFVKYLEDMANRKLLAEEFEENLMTVNGGVEYYFKDKITAHDRGMQDGVTMLARTIIGLSAVAVAGSATAANIPTSDAIDRSSGFVDGVLDSTLGVSSNAVQNTALHDTEKTVECIGVCESKEVFVSEVPDSGILDSVGDVIGSAVGMVGDGVGGALSAVGEVVGDVFSSL